MKQCIIFLFTITATLLTQAQTWVGVSFPQPKPAEIILQAGNLQNSQIHVELEGYLKTDVLTPNGTAHTITIENSTAILEAGAPDLPKITASLVIPDQALMEINVTASAYTEYTNIDIAPSKGNLTRDIDPSTVPFTYGSAYSQDGFYPGKLAELKDPYILRDLRGQVVVFYPFQYNPVTRVLRVYHSIDVNVVQNGTSSVNTINRTQPPTHFDPEFAEIYKTHFINYNNTYKYTPLSETGKMLIICYGNFMTAMEPYVIWKKTKGIPTEMVSVATAGGTSAAIKTYVTNYYNTNGLTYLLLVGDAAQVPTFSVGGGGSDNTYGYITGSDHYQEIIVGRFSAESTADVTTQVTRSVNYEKTPSATANKYNRCIGVASSEGPGDDNELDYQHCRNMQTDLMGFTYTSKAELFQGSQGGSDAAGDPTATMLGNEINSGAGIITYTGHGSDLAFSTTGFSTTNIASLTNTDILPFIWAVACVNGNFVSQTCFAEAWMRKQHNNQPAGAVATLMSTINQSWNPPMEGQDEMIDILVESYSNNIKRSFGGISVNGLFKMNDTYADYNMTDTWTVFGDPSLMVRTDNPASMTVSHNPTISLGESSLSVNCNVDGALVCLTINHEIIGTAYASGGSALITFPALTQIDTITVCATAFNYIPYLGEVAIISNNYPNDVQLSAVNRPEAAYNCEGLSITPEITIRNMGTNTLTSCTISYTINGGSPVSQNWSGSLAQYATAVVSLSPFTLVLGNHQISVEVSQPNGVADDNPANNIITKNFDVNDLPVSAAFEASQTEFCNAPASVTFVNQSQNAGSYSWDFGDGTTSTEPNPSHIYNNLGVYTVTLTAEAGACGNDTEIQQSYIVVGSEMPVGNDVTHCGAASFTLSASANGTLNWYDAVSGGNLLGTGNSYTTPTLTTTTSYYVENQVIPAPVYVGSTDSNSNGGYFTNTNVHYLIFDCFQPCTLVSVLVNASTAGNRVISLQNSSGTTLQSATINIPQAGIHRVTLNFSLPAGNNLRLAGPGSPNLYRNNAGVSYPYEVSGLVSIKSSSAGTTPLDYYYYFYEWEVQEAVCVSAREEITAFIDNNVPEADFSFLVNDQTVTFTDLSVNPAVYQWNFGDGFTSTDPDPVHTYASDGVYSVKQVILNGCGADSVTKDVVINTLGLSDNQAEYGIKIYPNPSRQGAVTIICDRTEAGDEISIFDIQGRLVHSIPCIAGDDVHYIWNAAGVQAGVYYMKLTGITQDKVLKIMITR